MTGTGTVPHASGAGTALPSLSTLSTTLSPMRDDKPKLDKTTPQVAVSRRRPKEDEDDLTGTRLTANPLSVLEEFGFDFSAAAASQRYEIFDEIGRGGVARVFIGYDRALQRQVAIKTLRKRLTTDKQAVSLFLNEAKISAKLQHPGIVPIHDIGALSSGELYFAMEKVEGSTLRQLIDERADLKRAPDYLLRIYEQICHIVAYAHSQGVVHRDLKPDNIMIGSYRDVFVMDWGIARDLTNPSESPLLASGQDAESEITAVRQARQVKGTPRYMSPEQTLGIDAQVDHRSDVFSLGLILYEVLTGTHPFTRDSMRDTLHAIRNDKVPRPAGRNVRNDLASICMKALQKIPTERYANAGELAAEVSAALSHMPVGAHQAAPTERIVKFIRRHQTATALALCIAIGTTFVIGVQYVRQQQTTSLVLEASSQISAARQDQERLQELARQLRAAATADRRAILNEIELLQNHRQDRLAGAFVLLKSAWEHQRDYCPDWAVSELKTLYIEQVRAELELGDPATAQQRLAELERLITRDGDRMQWQEVERTRLGALRDSLGPQPPQTLSQN